MRSLPYLYFMNAFSPLRFQSGYKTKNRFLLAPMTNRQSHADGQLSEDEYHWLKMRAEGGFGITMTCASHVQKEGQGPNFISYMRRWEGFVKD